MSMTTTLLHGTQTITHGGKPAVMRDQELIEQYTELIQQPKLGWTEHLRLLRQLGKGGQGVVYLSERRGSDNFTLPVALKFFSPERFADERGYHEAMERMAQVSSRVALIQHDNLLDVQNFIERRTHPRAGNGMGRRLRPRHAARPGNVGAGAGAGGKSPLGIYQ